MVGRASPERRAPPDGGRARGRAPDRFSHPGPAASEAGHGGGQLPVGGNGASPRARDLRRHLPPPAHGAERRGDAGARALAQGAGA